MPGPADGRALRPAIEERHRQYKCFWDLTRTHAAAACLIQDKGLREPSRPMGKIIPDCAVTPHAPQFQLSGECGI